MQRVPELTPEGPERSHRNIEVLQEFAPKMAKNIIQSLVSQMEMVEPEFDNRALRFNQNREMLADELASAVVEVALREVCRGEEVQEGSRSAYGGKNHPFMIESNSERSAEMEEIQSPNNTQPCHLPLSQSGLPVVGSLDDPNAPPTMPLLPELERSKHSFDNQASRFNQSREMLADELASAVVEVALREVCGVQEVEGHQESSRSARVKMDGGKDWTTESVEMEGIQTSKSTQSCHLPLSQSWPYRFNQNRDMLAEELASAVVEVALMEVCKGQEVEDHQEGSRSASRGRNRPFTIESNSERSVEMEDIQAAKNTQPRHLPLSQSGLPVLGSLDYPDAPPTTPLLPELERSRHSFARKLKGGLAKVFLPSPPPPTPKDHPGDSTSDPRVELMEQLMHSLSTNDSAINYFEVGAQMEAFAEALSCDIIGCVLRDKNRDDDGDLHLLAHQLAETILTSSLDEAKTLV